MLHYLIINFGNLQSYFVNPSNNRTHYHTNLFYGSAFGAHDSSSNSNNASFLTSPVLEQPLGLNTITRCIQTFIKLFYIVFLLQTSLFLLVDSFVFLKGISLLSTNNKKVQSDRSHVEQALVAFQHRNLTLPISSYSNQTTGWTDLVNNLRSNTNPLRDTMNSRVDAPNTNYNHYHITKIPDRNPLEKNIAKRYLLKLNDHSIKSFIIRSRRSITQSKLTNKVISNHTFNRNRYHIIKQDTKLPLNYSYSNIELTNLNKYLHNKLVRKRSLFPPSFQRSDNIANIYTPETGTRRHNQYFIKSPYGWLPSSASISQTTISSIRKILQKYLIANPGGEYIFKGKHLSFPSGNDFGHGIRGPLPSSINKNFGPRGGKGNDIINGTVTNSYKKTNEYTLNKNMTTKLPTISGPTTADLNSAARAEALKIIHKAIYSIDPHLMNEYSATEQKPDDDKSGPGVKAALEKNTGVAMKKYLGSSFPPRSTTIKSKVGPKKPPKKYKFPQHHAQLTSTTETWITKNSYTITSTPAAASSSKEDDPNQTLLHDIDLLKKISNYIVYVIIVIIIFSNIMVLTAYRRFRKLHSITNRFVVSLAVADLFVGLSRLLQEILNYWFQNELEDSYRCLFFYTFPTTMNAASLLSLLGVTIDRYISVMNPLRYHAVMTEKLANSIIITAWSSAFLIIFIASHFFFIKPGRHFCTYPIHKYILLAYFILFISILFVISLFYIRIFYASHKHLLLAIFSKDFSARHSSQMSYSPVPGLNENAGIKPKWKSSDSSDRSKKTSQSPSMPAYYSGEYNPEGNTQKQSTKSVENHSSVLQPLIEQVSVEERESNNLNNNHDKSKSNLTNSSYPAYYAGEYNSNGVIATTSSVSQQPANLKTTQQDSKVSNSMVEIGANKDRAKPHSILHHSTQDSNKKKITPPSNTGYPAFYSGEYNPNPPISNQDSKNDITENKKQTVASLVTTQQMQDRLTQNTLPSDEDAIKNNKSTKDLDNTMPKEQDIFLTLPQDTSILSSMNNTETEIEKNQNNLERIELSPEPIYQSTDTLTNPSSTDKKDTVDQNQNTHLPPHGIMKIPRISFAKSLEDDMPIQNNDNTMHSSKDSLKIHKNSNGINDKANVAFAPINPSLDSVSSDQDNCLSPQSSMMGGKKDGRFLQKSRTVSIHDESKTVNFLKRLSAPAKKITTDHKRRESAGVMIASKTTIMIAFIVGTFTLLGFPIQVAEYVMIFHDDKIKNFKAFYIIHIILVTMYYSNSAINPYIYAWKNRDFRDSFKRVLLCRGKEHGYPDDLPPRHSSTFQARLSRMFSYMSKTNPNSANLNHRSGSVQSSPSWKKSQKGTNNTLSANNSKSNKLSTKSSKV